MKTPLAIYDIEKNQASCGDYSKVVWAAIFDRRYKCEVQRVAPYKGVVVIFDGEENDSLLNETDVPISYDGQFGPDIIDISEWKNIILEKIGDSVQIFSIKTSK